MEMKWHFGKPDNPGELKFRTGTLLSKDIDGQRVKRHHFTRRELRGLYGLSFGDQFIGFMKFGKWGFENSPAPPYER